MTLFFYGAIALMPDDQETKNLLLQCAQDVGWTLMLNQLQTEFSLEDLIGVSTSQDWLVFELNLNDGSNRDHVYDEYGGDAMIAHYRAVARQLGIEDADMLDFGSSAIVDEAYQTQPADLPVIRFVERLLTAFPDRGIVLNLDQDFENRIRCEEVVGYKDQILRAVWRVVSFGYQWPNLRLKTVPV